MTPRANRCIGSRLEAQIDTIYAPPHRERAATYMIFIKYDCVNVILENTITFNIEI
jgi:hypothetical protein